LKNIKIILLALLTLTLVNCAPSAKQMKEAIEKDPSIVFVAIEKDPVKFMEVVQKAAQGAQERAQQDQQSKEVAKRDAEFQNPLKPEIDETRVIFGNKNAPVTVVEFSDFECPFCKRGYNTTKQVLATYGDKVRVIFKHLPLPMHDMAVPAAKYFEAIARQGHEKAEKFHDKVFENQKDLAESGEEFLKKVAKELGANMTTLAKDLKDASLMDRINKDKAEAEKFEISGTPGFIINGVSLRGAYPFEDFKQIIDRHLGTTK